MKLISCLVICMILIGSAIVGSARAEMWRALLAKADSLQKIAQFDSALVVAKQALEITERQYGQKDTSVMQALNIVGMTYYYLGISSEAESYYTRALGISEELLGPDNLSTGDLLCSLAYVRVQQGRYADAETLLKRALPIYEESLGVDDLEVAQSLNDLAVVCEEQGRHAEAEGLYRRALRIREKSLGEQHPAVAAALNGLALAYYEQGRFVEAEPLCVRALQIRENVLGVYHPDIATSLNSLARIFDEQGRYADVEPLLQRALQIWEMARGADHPDVANALNNLAKLYTEQGRLADAEPLFRRSLQISEKTLGAEHPYLVIPLSNLAALLHLQARYNEAEPLYQRARMIGEKTLGIMNPRVAVTLSNLAKLDCDQGRYADAEQLFQRALQIGEKSQGADHPTVAATLFNLAGLYDREGRHANAASLYQQALHIRQKTLGMGHPDVAASLTGIALNAWQRGQYAAAEVAESRAWEIRRQNFHDGGAVLAERNALEYSQFLISARAIYLSFLLESPGNQNGNSDAISKVVMCSKGQVSDAILARIPALAQEAGTDVKSLADTLTWARFALSKLYVDGPGEDNMQVYRRKLEAAVQKKESLEAELARRSASFSRKQELWDVDASKVSEVLPFGAALIEFMKYNHRIDDDSTGARYLVIILKSEGNPQVFPLGAASAIDTAVWYYRQQFRDLHNLDDSAYATASANLYGLVWRPFAALIEGSSTVFIAPDGNLNLVSFAGLKDDNGKYLIEDYPVHYLSTGRDLIRLQDNPAPGRGLLAMGDPDYDLSFQPTTGEKIRAGVTALLTVMNLRSSCEELSKLHVASLPGTRTEITAVSNQWVQNHTEPFVTYFGSDATEEQFKQNAPGKRVIHLATHGLYIGEECIPKLTRHGFKESGGYMGENPLLQCGFLLAGANRHGEGAREANREDGIVTAEDVAGLNLQGTDLVVLSSCESGLGAVKSGEGVYGLRRAFQMAGARTVISALWPIDDKATADFMGQLFAAKNESMHQTLQRIALNRLSVLRAQGKSDHPFYWAAFVATGDWKMH
jgi:CHAT domain-containing protein/Tfp pilus assembly protein PilF